MKYFGTDGFRGEANVDLNVVHAYKVGRFLGWYYGQEHKARIVIGKDTRRSSYMFEDALSSGLTASGADVYLLHVTPTPSVSYVVRTEQFDCGIMISASHNPYYDNGLKVINGNGHKLEAEVEEKIETYIDSPEDTIPFATREKIGRTVDYAIGRHRYIGYLMSLATRSFKNVRVGLDCANGSSYSVAKGVFDALGAKTYAIGMEPDGTNINDNCGSTHIENLQKYGVPVVVTLNRFVTDSQAELDFVKEFCEDRDCDFALANVWEQGGKGGIDLANAVLNTLENKKSNFKVLYDDSLSIKDKINCIATEIYGADGVTYSAEASKAIAKIEEMGFGNFPVCMAKNQYSLSDDPKKLGRPTGFDINIREVYVSAGAGFVVAITGTIMTMPGLPKSPAAERIYVDDDGKIVGLF